MITFISNITISGVFGTSQDRVAVVNCRDERVMAAAQHLASWQACHALARGLRGLSLRGHDLRGLKRRVKPVVAGVVAQLGQMCSMSRRLPSYQPVRLPSPPRS